MKKKTPKTRNWIAVHAHQRGGAGSHGDKRKEESRNACRGNKKSLYGDHE